MEDCWHLCEYVGMCVYIYIHIHMYIGIVVKALCFGVQG